MTPSGTSGQARGTGPLAPSGRGATAPAGPPEGEYPWTPWREFWTWAGILATGVLLVPGWFFAVIGFWPAWGFAVCTTAIWLQQSWSAVRRCHAGLPPLWSEVPDEPVRHYSRRTLIFLWWHHH